MSVTTRNRQTADQARAVRVQTSVGAAVACPLCLEVTAEVGLEVLTRTLGPDGIHPWWTKGSKTVRERAFQLTEDPEWRERALGWIDAYREAHGHGPSWRTFWHEPSLWPADATLALLNTAMRQLNEGGHLDGTKTPFGLCRRVQ
ncbi:hypothetical protein [Streptomyces sp. NBC_01361]|uniref:hypothetical protein n=1 Tax=Streptomyces sp. NBC_01361 TaxID=2903838 RepID=UPI002E2F103B|nr:hypothetical protein [Streptomyces sp. NBC_01361]